jgi:hypothetical protein
MSIAMKAYDPQSPKVTLPQNEPGKGGIPMYMLAKT